MSTKKLQKEIELMNSGAFSNISAGPLDSDIFHWNATIMGPENSPYEGGVFFVDILIPTEYPFKPPKFKFITKIYHCNVNAEGGICMDALIKEWSPTLHIPKVLTMIVSLMAEPNSSEPLVAEIATLYTSNREQHDTTAREWTQKYAM
eukprot:gene17834-24907_t